MILDARDHEVNLNREARFVIVGAGPAGLTLAMQLAERGSVLLIESGGFEEDARVQALYDGGCVGLDYSPVHSRARGFGGSSNLWAGYCAMPDAHDFSRRDWVPASGWPFDIERLRPYLADAASLLNVNCAGFDARQIVERAGFAWPFDEDRFVASVWRFVAPPLSLGERFRGSLDEPESATVLTHASVTDVLLDADHGAVKELVIRTLNGREARVRAEVVVLACGGMETPRILLNATGQLPYGIGNAHGLVGRHFMEHPHFTVDSVELGEAGWLHASADRWVCHDGADCMLAVGLTAEEQEAAGVLNARVHAFRAADPDDNNLRLGVMLEQVANPDSRITLSSNRDELGVRRICLDWQLTDLDWRTYRNTAQLVCEALEVRGSCRVSHHSSGPRTVAFCNHHMGTLRMAVDPEQGVVDADCRVHGMSNLYIAGSSVFPTGSWANPTVTLMALALRLADHLKGERGAPYGSAERPRMS